MFMLHLVKSNLTFRMYGYLNCLDDIIERFQDKMWYISYLVLLKTGSRIFFRE